jgi:hypothetical protein
MKPNEMNYIVSARLTLQPREFNVEFPVVATSFDEAEKKARDAAVVLGIPYSFTHAIKT